MQFRSSTSRSTRDPLSFSQTERIPPGVNSQTNEHSTRTWTPHWIETHWSRVTASLTILLSNIYKRNKPLVNKGLFHYVGHVDYSPGHLFSVGRASSPLQCSDSFSHKMIATPGYISYYTIYSSFRTSLVGVAPKCYLTPMMIDSSCNI